MHEMTECNEMKGERKFRCRTATPLTESPSYPRLLYPSPYRSILFPYPLVIDDAWDGQHSLCLPDDSLPVRYVFLIGDENETTLFENRPRISGLDHITENS